MRKVTDKFIYKDGGGGGRIDEKFLNEIRKMRIDTFITTTASRD